VRGTQVHEHGEDSAVVVGRFAEAELEENLANVGFDCLGTDEQDL
jgi:hypothetical protein